MSYTNGYAASNGVANGHGPTNHNHLLLFRPEIMAAITDQTKRSLLKCLGTLPERGDEADKSKKCCLACRDHTRNMQCPKSAHASFA